jgi:hypothetical protein
MLALLPEHLRLIADVVPARWNGEHVGLRLIEAMRTLSKIPMRRRLGFAHSWPTHAYEFADLLAQQEQGELERTMQERNHIGIRPSLQEMTAMETAVAWPAAFLSDRLDLAAAVNGVSLAHALDRDIRWLVRRRGGYIDTWRQRHADGCNLIAAGLRRARTRVF